MIDFNLILKSGHDKQALALIVGYSKDFKSHRFVYSTGVKVTVKGFKIDSPGKELKAIKEIVCNAYKSLVPEVNNFTLKKRIELFRSGLQWHERELHVYTKSNLKDSWGSIEAYTIPESFDRASIEARVKAEVLKFRPDTKKLIDSILCGGTNQLFGFWQGVLDGKIKPRHGKDLRATTLSSKKQTLKTVLEYQEQLGVNVTFESLDMKFYNDFTGWLRDSKGFDSNTIGKHVKELKAILHLANRNELIANDRFKYWPIMQESNEVITLSKDEILKIQEVKLTGTKADVRDIFILACFLGPRISDFKSLQKESLTIEAGVTYFIYVQEKTGKVCRIPVHQIALDIIDRRGGEFPQMISEQNFRDYLKEVCAAAKLNDRVITKIRDGKPVYKQKWEAISPHSARRTFASGLFYGWFTKAMPASLCMRYTGHKKEKSFMLYIGASERDLDEKALEYFDIKPQMKIA